MGWPSLTQGRKHVDRKREAEAGDLFGDAWEQRVGKRAGQGGGVGGQGGDRGFGVGAHASRMDAGTGVSAVPILLRNDGVNFFLDFFDAVVSVDDDDAVGFAGGDLFVLVVDAAVELVGLALEAVFVGALPLDVALVAAAGALQGGLERGQQEDREVGLEVVAGGGVHGEDAWTAELAAAALVGLGGVGVAIAEDDGAGGEGGEDDLGDGLGAVGEHEGHLGGGGDGADGGFRS